MADPSGEGAAGPSGVSGQTGGGGVWAERCISRRWGVSETGRKRHEWYRDTHGDRLWRATCGEVLGDIEMFIKWDKPGGDCATCTKRVAARERREANP